MKLGTAYLCVKGESELSDVVVSHFGRNCEFVGGWNMTYYIRQSKVQND